MQLIKGYPKEVYIIVFPTMLIADHWRVEFINKFAKDFVYMDRHKQKVELTDSVWYFRSETLLAGTKGLKGEILPPEAIYIILDDPERKKLDSYEGV